MARRVSLDKLANICIIIAALVVAASYMRVWVVGTSAKAAPSGYAAGEKVPPLQGVSYASAERSLLFFINSGCQYCTKSMPFYSTVVQRRDELKSRVAVIAVSIEDEADIRRYVEAYGVSPDTVVSVGSQQDFKLRMTPTLLLLDKQGKVERVWRGQLNKTQEKEVLAALES